MHGEVQSAGEETRAFGVAGGEVEEGEVRSKRLSSGPGRRAQNRLPGIR